jgi:hypothetical protein
MGLERSISAATKCGDLRIAQQSELYAYSVMACYLLRVKLDLLRLENERMVQQKLDFLQDFCRNQWLYGEILPALHDWQERSSKLATETLRPLTRYFATVNAAKAYPSRRSSA